MPKIKRFLMENKKTVRIVVIALIILLFGIILYKSLFYSNSEKAVYGIRTRDIKEHKLKGKAEENWKSKALEIDKITECKIVVKGRLIKFFITFEDGVSTDDIKTKISDVSKILSKNVTSYYDVTFYAKEVKSGETKYPVIGYKHKSKDSISFDTF